MAHLLTGVIQPLFFDEKYTDLTIKCGVLFQGDPYNDGELWDDGDSCEGDVGFERDGEETHGFSPIVFDVHMHNIAGKYDLPGLAVLAVASFKEHAEAEWDTEAFVEAASVVYTEAADREQQLKDIVLSVAHAHASSLTCEQQDEKQAFCKMACTVPALGTALWKEGTKTQEEYVRCPEGCGWRLPLDCMPGSASTTMRCLGCGEVSMKEQWKAVIVNKKGLAMDETNYFPDVF
ncbi:hypothetical protein LTR17_022603 [Elasticomyces elasticus]|nr:hypothetical protein LTR17_022603 [Elasticomyces elasticus]